jgi:hypothetical protein
VVDHIGIVLDVLAYALVMDAITHPGPANPARINRGICSEVLIPGADPLPISDR